MAGQLLAAGHEVTVWNRTTEKAEALGERGASVAGSAVEAIAAGEVVVTVLADAEATEDVLGDGGLDAFGEDAVWVQAATVGLAVDRLAERAAEHGVAFVDAPVLGTREPAEEGELLVIAAGAPDVREGVGPVLDAVGKRTLWVGDEPGPASRLKLVINAWLLGLLEALAESIGLAEELGLDPERFLEAIEGGPVGAPYARIKGSAMIEREFPASFPLRLALKDARLVEEAVERAGTDAPLATIVAGQLARAVGAGHGDEDMAAVYRIVRPTGARDA